MICPSLISLLHSTSFSAPFCHISAPLAFFHTSQLDRAGSFLTWRSLLKCYHFREALKYVEYTWNYFIYMFIFLLLLSRLSYSLLLFSYVTGIWQVFVKRIKEVPKLYSYTGINYMVKSYLQNPTKNPKELLSIQIKHTV